MKTPLAAVIIASALVPTLSLAQQERPQVAQVPTAAPRMVTAPPVMHPGTHTVSAVENERLGDNITIRLSSAAPDAENFDLEIIGSGPEFNVRQASVTDSLTVSCFYQITKKDASYQIKYQITIRSKVQTDRNTEYIETSIEGNVLCKDGEPITLLKSGKVPLRIVVNPKQEASQND